MWPMLLMAGMGALDGMKKEQQAERDRVLSAQTALYSPWTGMSPKTSFDAGPGIAGGLASGALSGYAQQQNLNAAASDQKLRDSQTSYWDALARQQQGGGRPAGVSGPVLPGGGFYSGGGR